MSAGTPRKLWEHPSPETTSMGQFKRELEKNLGTRFNSYQDLHAYSVANIPDFWSFLWKYSGIRHEGSCTQVVDGSMRMDKIPTWFDGIRTNFAENLLLNLEGQAGKADGDVAVVEVDESGPASKVTLTWGELRQRVGQLVQAMKARGLVRGDRVATCSGNNVDTMVVFLATTALGGVFSSSSTDMGVGGVLERLRQIKPRWVFMDDTALYNGKHTDLRDKMKGVVDGLKSDPEFQGIVSQPRIKGEPKDVAGVPRALPLREFLTSAKSDELEFTRINFRDPFLVAYSSGTTGEPKCIVHSVGGVLLNAYKEGALHQEFSVESIVLQYTTTSWIMYLASVQLLMFGTRVILYEGSPFQPKLTSLIELASRERATHMGISPRYLSELQKAGVKPRELVNLDSLKIVSSTGMILPDALFEWFYDAGFPRHVRLNNQSGGTEIAGCFGISNPLSPVYLGGCSGLGLGMPVKVYHEEREGELASGRAVKDGVPGELVATAAFPNMPVTFWGQDGPARYQAAYFAHFEGIWTHGDLVMIHPETKQLMFLGRSDGILNPSGVRFGSSEIYSVLEKEFPKEIADSICVGQRRPSDKDERVFLFTMMRPGVTLGNDLVARVKSAIQKALSKRHVPAFIFATPAIPTTINGKKVELPVKRIISGDKIKPSGTLLNPESLDYFYQFAEVENLGKLSSKL